MSYQSDCEARLYYTPAMAEAEELAAEYGGKEDYLREAFGDQTDYGEFDYTDDGVDCLGEAFYHVATVMNEVKGPIYFCWLNPLNVDEISF